MAYIVFNTCLYVRPIGMLPYMSLHTPSFMPYMSSYMSSCAWVCMRLCMGPYLWPHLWPYLCHSTLP